MPRALDADEEALAALLARAGLRSGEARSLALLLRGAILSRAEVARATGLAAQDVSAAMRALEAAGAVRVESVARDGPGRPALRYRLASDARAVLEQLEGARRASLARELEALDALRARAAAL